MDNKTIIEDFEKLLKFGEEETRNVQIDIKKQREKTILLFSGMGSIDENCRAVLVLIKNNNILPALGLLRTLLETYIKLTYIFKDNRQDNAKRFLLKSFHEKLRWMKIVKAFLDNNPDHGSGDFAAVDWDKEIQETEKIINKQIRKYPFLSNQMPNLADVSKKCDEGNDTKKTEFLYLTTHKYFSEHLHFGAVGLNDYFRPNENGGYWFDPKGGQDNIPMIIHTAHAIYSDMIRAYFRYFKIPKVRELKKYRPKLIQQR